MDIYEKLIILEAQRRLKDEEDEIFEVVLDKFNQYKEAYREYVILYSLFTRLISSARNISTSSKMLSELRNRILPANVITEEDTERLNQIMRCPYFYFMPQNSVNLMHQAISSLNFNQKLLNDIYSYIKQNKNLKETIDSILKGKENALQKTIPNLIDFLMANFEIE